MKATKYKRTYRLTVSQREADLILGALYNSSQEDVSSGDEETERDGFAKDKLWNELVAVAGHND